MKSIRRMLAASLMAAIAGVAFAAPRDVECEASKSPAADSTKSREDVKAEAKAAGKSYECGDVKTAPAAKSSKTRSQVKSESAAARKKGEVPTGDAAIPAR